MPYTRMTVLGVLAGTDILGLDFYFRQLPLPLKETQTHLESKVGDVPVLSSPGILRLTWPDPLFSVMVSGTSQKDQDQVLGGH